MDTKKVVFAERVKVGSNKCTNPIFKHEIRNASGNVVGHRHSLLLSQAVSISYLGSNRHISQAFAELAGTSTYTSERTIFVKLGDNLTDDQAVSLMQKWQQVLQQNEARIIYQMSYQPMPDGNTDIEKLSEIQLHKNPDGTPCLHNGRLVYRIAKLVTLTDAQTEDYWVNPESSEVVSVLPTSK